MGSPHAHLLLWLNQAPDEEVESNFMPNTVRTAEHLLSVDHDALERPRCQEHQHTHMCYKAAADEDKAGLKRYRFVETHDVMHSALDTTAYQSAELLQHHDIRDFDEYEEVIRSGLARPTLLLKTDMDQTNVNPFNPWIASVLKSNMDLQVIPDVYACAFYVVEYANKPKRGVSNLGTTINALIEQDPSAQMSFENAMRQLGVKMLTGFSCDLRWLPPAETSFTLTPIGQKSAIGAARRRLSWRNRKCRLRLVTFGTRHRLSGMKTVQLKWRG
ncbi:hypothetical protein HPB50_008063 [Hyalomma asiaticum]|uniref:Uncharacterized protein n=1 Tax=Hyalomma asiaticum TaxID=266040 RepID=A0ACB7SF97_HYAAI|nr:hypothetical protein HPB50_008063 [Hyalomma asiaticum]